MAKPEWGKKRTCQSCGTKYYDLNKTPMICPSCGVEFDPDLLLKTKKGKSLSSKIISNNEKELTADMSGLDDIDYNSDNEVVSDDDPLLEINKDDQNDIIDDDNILKDVSICPSAWCFLKDKDGKKRRIKIHRSKLLNTKSDSIIIKTDSELVYELESDR